MAHRRQDGLSPSARHWRIGASEVAEQQNHNPAFWEDARGTALGLLEKGRRRRLSLPGDGRVQTLTGGQGDVPRPSFSPTTMLRPAPPRSSRCRSSRRSRQVEALAARHIGFGDRWYRLRMCLCCSDKYAVGAVAMSRWAQHGHRANAFAHEKAPPKRGSGPCSSSTKPAARTIGGGSCRSDIPTQGRNDAWHFPYASQRWH